MKKFISFITLTVICSSILLTGCQRGHIEGGRNVIHTRVSNVAVTLDYDPASPEERFEVADAVALIKVTEVSDASFGYPSNMELSKVNAEVLEIYKGELDDNIVFGIVGGYIPLDVMLEQYPPDSLSEEAVMRIYGTTDFSNTKNKYVKVVFDCSNFPETGKTYLAHFSQPERDPYKRFVIYPVSYNFLLVDGTNLLPFDRDLANEVSKPLPDDAPMAKDSIIAEYRKLGKQMHDLG